MEIFPLSRIKTWIAIAAALLLGACASAKITLQSYPNEAEIYARPVGGGAERLLGKTPFETNASELAQRAGSSGPLYLEFRKEDHVASSAVLADPGANDMILSMTLVEFASLEQSKDVNKSIDHLFEAQRLARAGRFPDALAKIKTVQKEHPQLAAAYEIEGGIYYMQSKFKEAYDAYRQAAKLNPENTDSKRMRNNLAAKLGVSQRKPANTPISNEAAPSTPATTTAPATAESLPPTDATSTGGSQ